MTKWIMAVAVVVVVGAGSWWYFMVPHHQVEAQAQPPATPQPDTSNQALAQGAADIDAAMALNVTATSTDGLSAQVAQTKAVADLMSGLAIKLALRVSGNGASSTLASSSPMGAALSDLNAKLADAHLQASAALGHITNATSAEYAKAQADMRVAGQDFAAARADISTLFAALGVSTAATVSSTTLQ